MQTPVAKKKLMYKVPKKHGHFCKTPKSHVFGNFYQNSEITCIFIKSRYDSPFSNFNKIIIAAKARHELKTTKTIISKK